MVIAVGEAFINHKEELLKGTFPKSLIAASSCSGLCKELKRFAREHAYNARAVKEIELRGDNLLRSLLSYLWRAIIECSLDRKKFGNIANALGSPASTPFGEFVYSHISRNYVARFESALVGTPTPSDARYHQLLLLTDMISGMTENFALDLFEKFERLKDDRKHRD